MRTFNIVVERDPDTSLFVHWYEAHGIGRVRERIKQFLD